MNMDTSEVVGIGATTFNEQAFDNLDARLSNIREEVQANARDDEPYTESRIELLIAMQQAA